MNIAGLGIGPGYPCRTIAEISNNHNGSLFQALRMIAAAKEAGADFVKFQAYTPDELVALRGDGPAPEPWGSQGWAMRTLYERAKTPLEWFPVLFHYAREVGIVPFASVFGVDSLAVLERCDCPAYKIARLDNTAFQLTALVASRDKPMIVSRDRAPDDGMRGNWGDIQLYCPPGYPPDTRDIELPWFGDEMRGFGYTGLSSHCLDPVLPIAAVARGAKLLEYHFMLADEPSELEANVSLNQYQFRQMVHDIRQTEAMLCD